MSRPPGGELAVPGVRRKRRVRATDRAAPPMVRDTGVSSLSAAAATAATAAGDVTVGRASEGGAAGAVVVLRARLWGPPIPTRTTSGSSASHSAVPSPAGPRPSGPPTNNRAALTATHLMVCPTTPSPPPPSHCATASQSREASLWERYWATIHRRSAPAARRSGAAKERLVGSGAGRESGAGFAEPQAHSARAACSRQTACSEGGREGCVQRKYDIYSMRSRQVLLGEPAFFFYFLSGGAKCVGQSGRRVCERTRHGQPGVRHACAGISSSSRHAVMRMIALTAHTGLLTCGPYSMMTTHVVHTNMHGHTGSLTSPAPGTRTR